MPGFACRAFIFCFTGYSKNMIRTTKKWAHWIICLGLLFVKPSIAADLICAYEDAFKYDPTYKQAVAARLAAREALPQSIAALLPNISGNISDIMTRSRYSLPRDDTRFGTNNVQNYTVTSYSLTITQPIFNFSSWMTVRQASAQVKQADATYIAALQDLMVRVSQAYFNVLLAEDALRITQAQKAQLAKQLDHAKQRYEVGVSPITNMLNAQASYDTVSAQEIVDKNTVSNQYEALRALTGHRYPSLTKLQQQVPLVTPSPANMEQWVNATQQQNLQLKAARFGADAAKENIRVQAGGHIPTIDATGNYVKNHGGLPLIISGGNIVEQTTVGVSMAVPLFQGGLVSSQVQQAQYLYQQAVAQAEFTHHSVVTQTRQTYSSILANISSIKADQQTIKSTQSAYESNLAAYEAGTITIVDVLLAQNRLFDAERQYAADQYTYLLNTIKLKQLAGTLNADDILIINCWLTGKTFTPAPSKKSKKLK